MTTDVSVNFDDLESAFDWVSADGALRTRPLSLGRAAARSTSSPPTVSSMKRLRRMSMTEVNTGQLPQKNDLCLGRSLVLRLVSEALPEDHNFVRAFFERRGAYSKFEVLLRRRGQLEHWFAYETQATEQRSHAMGSGVRVPCRPLRRFARRGLTLRSSGQTTA